MKKIDLYVMGGIKKKIKMAKFTGIECIEEETGEYMCTFALKVCNDHITIRFPIRLSPIPEDPQLRKVLEEKGELFLVSILNKETFKQDWFLDEFDDF